MNNPPPSRGRWARTNGRPSSIAGAEPMTGGGVGHFREASDQTTIKNKLSAFSQRPVTAYRNEPPVLMLDDKSRAAVEQGRQQRGTGNQHSTNARPATSYDPRRGGGGQLNVGGGGWRHLSSSNNAVSADSKHRHGMGSWRVPKPTRADVDADPPKSSRTQLKPTQDLVPQTRRSWGRLKPPSTDPLEEYGLPSKGETRYVFTLPDEHPAPIRTPHSNMPRHTHTHTHTDTDTVLSPPTGSTTQKHKKRSTTSSWSGT